MIDDFRDCPGCGSEREFTRVHARSGRCPDSPDGVCPEWFCTGCGTGLLIGLLPGLRELIAASAPSAAGQLDRVA